MRAFRSHQKELAKPAPEILPLEANISSSAFCLLHSSNSLCRSFFHPSRLGRLHPRLPPPSASLPFAPFPRLSLFKRSFFALTTSRANSVCCGHRAFYLQIGKLRPLSVKGGCGRSRSSKISKLFVLGFRAFETFQR